MRYQAPEMAVIAHKSPHQDLRLNIFSKNLRCPIISGTEYIQLLDIDDCRLNKIRHLTKLHCKAPTGSTEAGELALYSLEFDEVPPPRKALRKQDNKHQHRAGLC